MVAELNRWLDRPGDAPLGEVAELPAVTAPNIGWRGWQEAAVQSSPAVQVARAAVAAAERRLAVSRLDLKPDFSPSAGIATQGSMGNVVTLRFGVELPFRKAQRQEPMIRAAEHELEAARREQADAEAMARAEAARVAARWRQADRQIVRFREAILPQTSTGLDASRASYLAGRGDFSTVVENFGMWLESRVQLARREADRFVAWAESERLVPHPPAPSPTPSPQPGEGEQEPMAGQSGWGRPSPGGREGVGEGTGVRGQRPAMPKGEQP
jgi:outer membrane protein TolC